MSDDADKEGTWLADGEVWFPDAEALCRRLNIAYLTLWEGDIFAGLPGKGEVSLASLLLEDGKPETATDGNVTTLKPAPRRT